MQQIDYLTVRGFRSISLLEKVHLGSVNVLIGANGAGKSNFLAVFDLLQAAREGRLDSYVGRAGGAERLLHFGSKRTRAIEFEFGLRSPSGQFEMMLEPTSGDRLHATREKLTRSASEEIAAARPRLFGRLDG